MKEKIQKFMQGRYGVDQFSRFLIALSFVLLLLSFLIRRMNFVYLLAMAVFIYCYYRIFSKNFPKRYEENQWYLRQSYKWYLLRDKLRKKWQQKKQYHIYKCPNCRQKIRIPRGKGKVAISCPKCHNEFVKKS